MIIDKRMTIENGNDENNKRDNQYLSRKTNERTAVIWMQRYQFSVFPRGSGILIEKKIPAILFCFSTHTDYDDDDDDEDDDNNNDDRIKKRTTGKKYKNIHRLMSVEIGLIQLTLPHTCRENEKHQKALINIQG